MYNKTSCGTFKSNRFIWVQIQPIFEKQRAESLGHRFTCTTYTVVSGISANGEQQQVMNFQSANLLIWVMNFLSDDYTHKHSCNR